MTLWSQDTDAWGGGRGVRVLRTVPIIVCVLPFDTESAPNDSIRH